LTKRQYTVIINNMGDKQYTIDELSEKTGFSRRTIRYYIQEGLLEPPAGRGRGGFYYDSHLEKLLYIKSLQERGLSLSAILKLLKTVEIQAPSPSREVWVKYEVVPGLEINIRRDLEQQASNKITEIIKIARALLEEKNNNE
jgi:DNA-binding transcriptional MerR regulator